MTQLDVTFDHTPHVWTRKRLEGIAPPPAKVDDERVGLNGKLGLLITTIVGTMWTAYLFTLLALISLPSAIKTGDRLIIVAWIAQTFLQLVLLPIIIVGQNIQAKASDKRAEQTYKDAEAVLHECMQIQAHLTSQDHAQQAQLAELRRLVEQLPPTTPADGHPAS
jgi:hypothetical protein